MSSAEMPVAETDPDVRVVPLTSTIGARVDGVDLGEGWTDEHVEVIHRAVLDHLVVVLPGQHLSAEQQRDFAATFGPLQAYPPAEFFGDLETIVVIDNENNVLPLEPDVGTVDDAAVARRKSYSRPNNFAYWHSDYTFNRYIPSVGLMRAEVIPDYGGDTVWANNYAAFEGLSPTMRHIVADLDAVHWTGPGFPERFGLARFGADAEDRFNREFPPVAHPMVITHPETKRPALFVNPQYVTHVVGLSQAESTMLLQFLFRHMTSPAYLFRHHWTANDLVIWDERATVHVAPTDFQPARRRHTWVGAGFMVPSR